MTTKRTVKITFLMDNRSKPGLCAEHGFSAWIESDGQRVLFDAGNSDALAGNAEKLGIDLTEANLLVLSHGHSDHTGYVRQLLQRNPMIQVLMHPKATQQRYSIPPGQASEEIFMLPETVRALEAHPAHQKVITDEPHQVWNWLGSSGTIPRRHSLEDAGGPFFLDAEGQKPDLIEDDLALWIKTPKGLVILTGCCHAGLINTVEQIKTVTGETSIYAIMGGLHLQNASVARIDATMEALKQWNPDYLIPCHCTGDKVIDLLQREFGYHMEPGYSGLELMISPQISSLTEKSPCKDRYEQIKKHRRHLLLKPAVVCGS